MEFDRGWSDAFLTWPLLENKSQNVSAFASSILSNECNPNHWIAPFNYVLRIEIFKNLFLKNTAGDSNIKILQYAVVLMKNFEGILISAFLIMFIWIHEK